MEEYYNEHNGSHRNNRGTVSCVDRGWSWSVEISGLVETESTRVGILPRRNADEGEDGKR